MVSPLLDATARNGRVVTICSNSADAPSTFRVEAFLPKASPSLGFRVFTSIPPPKAVKDMASLADQAAAGTLEVKVQATFAADALPLIPGPLRPQGHRQGRHHPLDHDQRHGRGPGQLPVCGDQRASEDQAGTT